jgi:hypothetical protein
MIVGGVVFVVAFFGCCGAAKESSCMILTVTTGSFSWMDTFFITFLLFAVLSYVGIDIFG